MLPGTGGFGLMMTRGVPLKGGGAGEGAAGAADLMIRHAMQQPDLIHPSLVESRLGGAN